MSYTGKHVDDTIQVDSSGNVTVKGITGLAVGTTTLPTGVIANFSSTNSIYLPRGTTAQRPGSPSEGYFRYNTTDSALEVYDGGWTQLVGVTVSTISEGDSSVAVNDSGTGNVTVTVDGSSQLVINASSADFQNNSITTTGNITTTAQLGVGGAVNSGRELTVTDASSNAYISIESSSTALSGILFGDSASDTRSQIIHNNNDDSLTIRTGGSDAVQIDSSGNVTFFGDVTLSSSQFATDIVPDTDLTYSLGTTSLRWTNVYTGAADIDGAIIVGDLDGNGSRLRFLQSTDTYIQAGSSSTTGSSAKIRFTEYLSSTTTMTVDIPNNRVGINTTSPVSALDVVGRLNVSDAANNDRTDISFSSGLRIYNKDNSDIIFGTSNTEQARLDDTGNFGIKSSTPGTRARLEVQDGSRSISFGADNGATTLTNSTDKAGRLVAPHYTNAEEPMLALLASSTSTANVLYMGGGTSLGNAATDLRFYTAANSTTVTGTERMRIDNSGNVGIGTDSPTNELHVVSSATLSLGTSSTYSTRIDDNLYLGGDANGAYIQTFNAKPLYINYQGNNTILNALGGNVGIGTTSPDTKLHVDGGDIKLSSGTSTTRRIQFIEDDTTYNLGTSGGAAIVFVEDASNNHEIQFEVHEAGVGHVKAWEIDHTGDILPGTTNTYNIGASGNVVATVYATTFDGEATSAQYADLAELYAADRTYEPGTVLSFGGEFEVTEANVVGSTKVAGVVSTNPAHLMNSHLEADHPTPVALQGRVPCKVQGRVRKGDMMVASATPGHAEASDNPTVGSVIGKALENFDGDTGVIEVVVGRV